VKFPFMGKERALICSLGVSGSQALQSPVVTNAVVEPAALARLSVLTFTSAVNPVNLAARLQITLLQQKNASLSRLKRLLFGPRSDKRREANSSSAPGSEGESDSASSTSTENPSSDTPIGHDILLSC